jgi:Galactose oxidase, central domain
MKISISCLGFTKLLVGIGETANGLTDSFEIIDLSMPSSVCQNLPNFPYATFGSVGEFIKQDHPLICGGEDIKQCYSFKDDSWQEELSLAENRGFASSSPSPFPNHPFSMLISGGNLPTTSSSVYLSDEAWKPLPDLPTIMYHHCMVKVSSSIVMVIGGYQDRQRSKKTFLLDTKENVWKEGPSLLQERDSFGCGQIRSSKNSSEFSIIVAGGYNGATFLRTTEVLDQSMQEWKQGPVLPLGICRNRIVEDADGGVVMVGGWVLGGQSHLDTLFRLPHAGQDGEWKELPQKLKIGTRFQIALMLPDHLANCN